MRHPLEIVLSFPKNSIYGICDPSTGEVRYVGRSNTGKWEPNHYLKEASGRLPDGNWKWDRYIHRMIRKMRAAGREPEITVLEEFEDDAPNIDQLLNDNEVCAITFYRERGDRLVNLTNGGKGTSGYKHTEEAKQLIGEKNSIALLGNTPWNAGLNQETRFCEQCNRTFPTQKSHSQKFCTPECYHAHPVSEESKLKNSKASKGRKMPESALQMLSNRESVVVECVNDHKRFRSMKEAAAHYGLVSDTVRKIARGLQGPTRSGLSFKIAEVT